MTHQTILDMASKEVGVRVTRAHLRRAVETGFIGPCKKVGSRNRYEESHYEGFLKYLAERSITVFEAHG